MGRLRILHISDLHERVALDWMPAPRKAAVALDATHRGELLDDRFYREIGALAAAPIDLICFTGDVADWGLADEYALATRRLQQIADAAGVPMARVFVVPGNHDVQRKVNESAWAQLRAASAEDPAAIGRYLAGQAAPRGIAADCREQVLARTAAFWTWLRRDLARTELVPPGPGHLGYRVSLDHGGAPVHIIGLDSAWLCGDDNDQGKILVTTDQVRLLARDGERTLDGLRIALIHHPLDHLADHHAVRRVLARHVDLVLHGHQHEPVAFDVVEPDLAVRILAAGCLVEGLHGAGWPNQFQLIEIDSSDTRHRITVFFRQWSERGFWTQASDLYREATGGVLHWHDDPVNDRKARAPRMPGAWEDRLASSDLWARLLPGARAEPFRDPLISLARWCQPLVESRDDSIDRWSDPGRLDRTLGAIELLMRGGWEPLSPLEVAVALAAPLLRETFLGLAYRRLLATDSEDDIAVAAGLQDRLVELASGRRLTDEDSLAAHRATSDLPASWSLLDRASAWFVPGLHWRIEKLAAVVSMVAPAPELARAVGSASLASQSSALAFGRRDLVALTIDGTAYTVRERAIARLLALAGTMAFDVRHVPAWLLATIRSSDPVTPASWQRFVDGLSWALDAGGLVLQAGTDHPAIYEHAVATCESLQQALRQTRAAAGAADPLRDLAHEVSHRALVAARSGEAPAFSIPVPRLTVPSEQVLAIASSTGGFAPSEIALELYKNAHNACAVRALRERYFEIVDGAPRDWRGRIEIRCGQDELGSYVECSDNGCGMTPDDLRAHLLTAGSSFWQSRRLREDRASWVTAGVGCDDAELIGGDGLSMVRILAHARELLVESFSLDGDRVASWAARVTVAGRVVRMMPRAPCAVTRVRVYLAAQAVSSADALLAIVRDRVWVPSFALQINNETWEARRVKPTVASVATGSPELFWCKGDGAVLEGGLATGTALPGVIHRRHAAGPLDPALEDAALQELDSVERAPWLEVRWLWALEARFPRVAKQLATRLAEAHRTLQLGHYSVPIHKLGVSRLDSELFEEDPTTNEATTTRGVSDRAVEPEWPHAWFPLPTWLLAARLAGWAAQGVVLSHWKWRPELLKEDPPPCPALAPGDVVALSRDANARPPWVAGQIPFKHLIVVACRLGETLGDVERRLGKFAALGVTLPTLGDETRSAAPPLGFVEILERDACPAWMTVRTAVLLRMSFGDAQQLLHRLSFCDARELPGELTGRKPGAVHAALLARVTASGGLHSAEISVRDLLGTVGAHGASLESVLAAASELAAIGIPASWPAAARVDREISRGDAELACELLDADGTVLLGPYLRFVRSHSAAERARVVSLLQALEMPTSHPWPVIEGLPPSVLLEKILSRDGDGLAPWVDSVELWRCVAVLRTRPVADAVECLDIIAAGKLLSAEELAIVRELVAGSARRLLDMDALITDRMISAEHLLWISATLDLSLGEVVERLDSLREAGVPCAPAQRVLDDRAMAAHHASDSDLDLLAPDGQPRPIAQQSLQQLLDRYHQTGGKIGATLRVLRNLGARVPVLSDMTMMLLSVDGDGAPPWRARPVPLASVCRAAAVHGVAVGSIAAELRDAVRDCDFPGPPGSWTALADVRPSESDVTLVQRLLGALHDVDGLRLRLGAVLQAALNAGTAPAVLIEQLAWLTRVGVSFPPISKRLTAEPEDVVLLSETASGTEPWAEHIDGGHVLLASFSLDLSVAAVLRRAARYARSGCSAPEPLDGLSEVASRADLVAASRDLTGVPPWIKGEVTRAHVKAAAAANRESEELTLARLARYAALLGIAVPDSGSTARGATPPPSAQRSRLRLVVVESKGTRVVELSQRITTVGRAAGSDLRLEDNLVSRNHARLVRRNDGSVLVMDAGSTNGTYLDGVQITTCAVTRDAELKLGNSPVRILFRFGASEHDAAGAR